MEFQHELIIPNEGLPFKIFLFEGGQGHYEREKHWHTSIEIFAVLKGRLTFFLNDEEYPLEAGELIIINSNEIHSIYAPEKNETVVLQIPLKQFEKYFTAQRFIRFTSAARLAKDKNTKAPDNRKLAFFIEELHKVYHAIVEGILEKKKGTLEYSLIRQEGTKQRLISKDGQKCITHYKVLKEFDTYSFVEISIETGRTHQIRAGMANAGHPLCGDVLYGGSTDLISRPALHCAVLDLKQPFKNTPIHIELEEAEDMKKLLK